MFLELVLIVLALIHLCLYVSTPFLGIRKGSQVRDLRSFIMLLCKFICYKLINYHGSNTSESSIPSSIWMSFLPSMMSWASWLMRAASAGESLCLPGRSKPLSVILVAPSGTS